VGDLHPATGKAIARLVRTFTNRNAKVGIMVANDFAMGKTNLLMYTTMYNVEAMKCNNTNVLWIRNCSAYREPMTSHALGGLEERRRTLLYKALSTMATIVAGNGDKLSRAGANSNSNSADNF